MTENEQSAWGASETQYFYNLTPEKILSAIEACGLSCTGRCMALNSMENRVYEIEINLPFGYEAQTKSEAFRIAKFYRPGRWTKEQILEEHEFLFDLQKQEIPVVAPLKFDGQSIFTMPESKIYYCIFPKVGGRNPDELNDDQLRWLGRLLARMHNVGQTKPANNRVLISPDTYGRQNLVSILESNLMPTELSQVYETLVNRICDLTAPWFAVCQTQRIHGDAHLGNLLWNDSGPSWVDFDDMLRGPCIQDLWLVLPGRDEYAIQQLKTLLSGYTLLREFDRQELRLIEALRALRMIHFSAWIAKRWEDPAFPAVFQSFGSPQYWQGQIADLQDQLQLMELQEFSW